VRVFSAFLAISVWGCTETGLTEQPADSDTVVDTGRADTDPTDTDETDVIDSDTGVPSDEPVADAGPDQSVAPLTWVDLDGRASFDPQKREPLRYVWRLLGKPAGSGAKLDDSTTSIPRFMADIAGEYRFDLSVMNTAGTWDPTPDEILVHARPADSFYVQVTWDTKTDQDLHLLTTRGQLYWKPFDCNFCNRTPSWGEAGPDDNPSLDWDAKHGEGPETITITTPADDTYRAAVVYYGARDQAGCGGPCPPTRVNVALYLDGVERQRWTRDLTKAYEVWNVFELSWPDQTLRTVDTVTTTRDSQCK
jgi:hypothetical protein